MFSWRCLSFHYVDQGCCCQSLLNDQSQTWTDLKSMDVSHIKKQTKKIKHPKCDTTTEAKAWEENWQQTVHWMKVIFWLTSCDMCGWDYKYQTSVYSVQLCNVMLCPARHLESFSLLGVTVVMLKCQKVKNKYKSRIKTMHFIAFL